MTRIRYRKNEEPGPDWPRDPDWPVYDVQVQDEHRGRWRHVGRVARFGQGDWAALGAKAPAWTTYHPTRHAAVAEMLAGRTFLDRMREGPGTRPGDVAGRPGMSDGDGAAAAGRVYERDGEVYRGHRYSPRGTQSLASADYIVRRDSDARYGGFITDTARDGGRPPGDGYRFEVYDDSGRHLAGTRSFRGALMVLAMPRRTRWIAEHLPPGLRRDLSESGPPDAAGRASADAAWQDYRIAWAGASNPAGVRRAIARHEAVLGARHPAVEAMRSRLAFLEGTGPGPDAALLELVDAHARRLGLHLQTRQLQPGGSGEPSAAPPAAPSGELAGDSAYRAALAALDSFGQVAGQHQQAAETLEAQLTVHGFSRHPELMAHVTALRALAAQVRTDAARARQVLADHHGTGHEYHTSRSDAHASAFRNT